MNEFEKNDRTSIRTSDFANWFDVGYLLSAWPSAVFLEIIFHAASCYPSMVATTHRASALIASHSVLLINRPCMETYKTDKNAALRHGRDLAFINKFNDLHTF